MRKIMPLLLCILFACTASHAQTDAEKAKQILRNAVKTMDSGDPDLAIKMLDTAKKLDPGNYVYDYESGYAYNLKKEYKKAAECFERAATFKEADRDW